MIMNEEIKLIEIDRVPSYLWYFHSLANSGIGQRKNNEVSIILAPIDRRCHDKLDNIVSVTLAYEKEKN